ncbi:aconitase X [Pseudomonas sp.]|uniref:cis-3-hydroxy-L-proline dehydratase n=1 Tax=Pseudomonas sp. TaxID=306 RepID=UPI003569DF69
MPEFAVTARRLVAGNAQGQLLYADVGLSFWGGVDPFSGEVIDRHHPLSGQIIAGRVLAIPSGRGSCTGSSVLLELILNGHAPAALVVAHPEEILSLGVLIAQSLFDCGLPVVCIGPEAFSRLHDCAFVRVEADRVSAFTQTPADNWQAATPDTRTTHGATGPIALNDTDRDLLAGKHGKAAQVAMQIVLQMAELQGAGELIDITQAHIDGCIYTGPASLRFAEQLLAWGAAVRVPTTLNSISVDQRLWRQQGIDPAFGEPASQLGEAYMAMGAQLSYTCAPYLLDSAPQANEQVVWAESNAVVYANSVLGARTQKYPDYLDICIALTGRAPLTGCHLDAGRLATLLIQVAPLGPLDDAFYPLLGYHVGALSGSQIPVLDGLQNAAPTLDDLKAFGAAFATTSGAPMFHIAGVTPEAASLEQALGGLPAQRIETVSAAGLLGSWNELNSAPSPQLGLVALGNPHFSLSEFAALAALCEGRSKHPDVALVITCGRHVQQQASAAGYLATLDAFGAQLVTDTCWCMLGEPVLPVGTTSLMTNSGKYAHYAPGLVGRTVHFGSLAACVEAACRGFVSGELPAWLSQAHQPREILSDV